MFHEIAVTVFRWVEQAPMAQPRSAFGCGRVEGALGTEIVVLNTGGEIYSLADRIWRPAPEFPREKLDVASVMQFENDFFFVGGKEPGANGDTVWQFDAQNYDWILREEKLSKPKFNALHSTVVIDRDFLPQC